MNAKKEVLIFSNDEYHPEKNNGSDMSPLVFFLINEIGCQDNTNVLSKIENWLRNLKDQSITLNVTYLEKDGALVLLGSNTFDFFVEIERDNFIKVLNDWKRVAKQKPKKIVISRKNDTFILEGYDQE